MSASDPSIADMIAKAQWYKDEGNTAYKKGDYIMALSLYTKIFLWINHLDVGGEITAMCATFGDDIQQREKTSKEQMEQVKQLKLLGYLNCCMAALKTQQYEKALQFVTKVTQNTQSQHHSCNIAHTVVVYDVVICILFLYNVFVHVGYSVFFRMFCCVI